MAFIAVLIGAILIVAAIRNSHKALFSALGQDVPGYVVWAAAILAIGVIGWVPGLSPLSRGLLALVILVIVLNNYQKIITGFEGAFKPQAATAGPVNTGSNGVTPQSVLGALGIDTGGDALGESFYGNLIPQGF